MNEAVCLSGVGARAARCLRWRGPGHAKLYHAVEAQDKSWLFAQETMSWDHYMHLSLDFLKMGLYSMYSRMF